MARRRYKKNNRSIRIATRTRRVKIIDNNKYKIKTMLRLNQGVHYFKRTVSVPASLVDIKAGGNVNNVFNYDATNNAWIIATGNTGTSNATYYSFGIKFNLTMLQSIADFTSLFDAYKINKIKLKITPFSTTADLQDGQSLGTSNQNLSCIYYDIIDRDDNTAFSADVTGLQQMQQYDTIKERNLFARGGRPIKRYWTPAIAGLVHAGGVFPAYTVQRPKWLDLNQTDTEHYGYKGFFQVFSPNPTVQSFIWLKIEATLYCAMRGVR